jgi:DNA-binding transcriptional regulator YiaG
MKSTAFLEPGAALAAESLAKNPQLEYRDGCLRKRPRDPAVERLLNELRAWCEAEYGRQAEVARILGVDNRRVNDWFSGRIDPSLAVGLRIQAFLASQKGRRRRPGPEGDNKP